MTNPLTPAELAEICATTDYAERGRYGFPRLLREVERMRSENAAMRAVVDAAVEWAANPAHPGPLSKAVNAYIAAREVRA